MSENQITASALTTFDIDDSGENVRINLRDQLHQPAALVLPVQCIHQLLMTLPTIIQAAMRNSHGDSSLRLIHPLSAFRLERGEPDPAGLVRFILTVETAGGFAVSFSAADEDLNDLAAAIADHGIEDGSTMRRAQLHS